MCRVQCNYVRLVRPWVWMYMCVRSCLCKSVSVCSHCSKRNTNYWASGSVKCTAVVTVSARWTIELVYNLTVGGVSRSHPENHRVALPSSANVNQQVGFKAPGIQAKPASLCLNPLHRFNVYIYISVGWPLLNSRFVSLKMRIGLYLLVSRLYGS